MSDQHRQAGTDLVHLGRNTGPKIAITAVVHARAGVWVANTFTQ